MRVPHRRGTVSAALIIVLAILMLITVGMIMAGVRDQDLTMQRLDTVRAFYATEAGMNMALRELLARTDADGDGSVGSISDDGDSDNDPAFGNARVAVTATAASGETTVSASGRSGSCRRRVQAVIAGTGSLGTGNSHPMCAMGRSGSNSPRYSLWSAGAWGPNTAMPWSLGNVPQSVALRPCPIRDEILFACIDEDKDVSVAVFDGSSWSSPTTVCGDAEYEDNRPFDAAYESESGRALVAYWDGSVDQIRYNTWNGTAWSSAATIGGSGATAVRFLTLITSPVRDEIICLFTTEGANALKAAVWNGSSWSSWTTLSTSINGATTECFAGAYETYSGNAVVVYAESGQAQPRYRAWSGTAWSAASNLPTMNQAAIWMRLAPNPAGNTLVLGASNTNEEVFANVWNGSAWQAANELFVSSTGGHERRRFDIAYEPGAGAALFVYRNHNKNYPVYRVWDGSSWSEEVNAEQYNRKLTFIYMAPGYDSGEVFTCGSDDKDDMHLMRWASSAMQDASELETSLVSGQEPISIVASPMGGSVLKIISWSEVEP